MEGEGKEREAVAREQHLRERGRRRVLLVSPPPAGGRVESLCSFSSRPQVETLSPEIQPRVRALCEDALPGTDGFLIREQTACSPPIAG